MGVKVGSRWLKGRTDKEKDKIRSQMPAARYILTVLQEIIADEVEQIRAKVRKPEALSNPNWPNEVAYHLGEEKALYTINQIINKRD